MASRPQWNQSLDEYASIKETVDEINKKVNRDKLLHDAPVKRNVYSKAGFEVVMTTTILSIDTTKSSL